MPSKRKTSAAQGRKKLGFRAKKSQSQQGSRGRAQLMGQARPGTLSQGRERSLGDASAFLEEGASRDILGVVLMVVALALAVALVAPSSAPVTHALEEFLSLGFGLGAFLLPLSLFLFAASFFVKSTKPLSSRLALGLTLIVLCILSAISLAQLQGTFSVSELIHQPALAFDSALVRAAGGYVGGGLGFALYCFLGFGVSVVLLLGIALVGIIICGFSISSVVEKLRDKFSALRDAHARKKLNGQALFEGSGSDLTFSEAGPHGTAQMPQSPRAQKGGSYAGAPSSRTGEDRAFQEAPTSFLGERKTTVLKRSPKNASQAASGLKPIPEKDPFDLGNFPDAEFRPEDFGVKNLSSTAPGAGFSGRGKTPHPPLDLSDQGGIDESSFEQLSDLSGAAGAAAGAARAEEVAGGFMPSRGSAGGSATEQKTIRLTRAKKQKVSAASRERAEAKGTQAASSASAGSSQAASQKDPSLPDFLQKKAQAAPLASKRPGEDSEEIKLPPLSLLNSNPSSASSGPARSELAQTLKRLQSTLVEFGLSSKVVGFVSGPLVTTFKIEMGEGERVNKIVNLEDDIALSLAAESVRIFAPIPGTSLVGIEIPNQKRHDVCLGDVLPYAQDKPLELAIGRDSEGEPVVADLASMPHLLIAGATGSGKSVMINSIIMSILMRATPDQVRLIMIDPKRVELGGYNGLPHLYIPVVTEPRQAASALQWAVSEMDRRLKVFERAGAREIKIYNKMCRSGKLAEMDNPPSPMPYLVIIIDELSDLMMVAGKDVEASIVRIAQLARAAGIHLIVATQRPSADVVTGLIKSNIENRIAFSVASGTDSRVILDQTGAERLLGRGDMLFKHRGKKTQRILGCYVSDPEIEAAIKFIRSQQDPDYHSEILSACVPGQPSASQPGAEDDDPLLWEAAQIVVDSQLGSTSGLQRRLKVGYARAGRIMDMLENKGIVGPPDGSKPREVLLDKAELADLQEADAQFKEV